MDEKRAFVLAIWPAAAAAAQRVGWRSPDIIVTAARHESDNGKSGLAQKGKNLFGIKATKSWIAKGGNVINMKTGEVFAGKAVDIMANFRAYDTWADSINDYVGLITGLSRYAKADAAAKRGDFVAYFTELQKGGYATDPAYAEKLARVHRATQGLIV